MKNLLQSKNAGSTLVMVMFLVAFSTVLGVAVLAMGMQQRIFAVRTGEEIAVRCAADAGLTKAIYQMNQKLAADKATLGVWNADPAFLPSATNAALPACNAVYSYIITKSGSDYIITSTGTCGQAQKQVTCTLVVDGPFDFAIFANDYLWFANGSTFDQYNTDPYAPTLKIGTNTTKKGWVFIANDSQINGDVAVGCGGDPADVIQNHGTITGNQYVLPEPSTLDSITVPSSFASMGSLGKLTGGDVTASGKYDKIDLGNKETITIKGPVTLYVTGDVSLGNEAQIIVDGTTPNSSLRLYLGGDFKSNNGSNINNQTQNPHNMEIFALDSCTKIYLMNSVAFYGAIYAPKAEVIGNNFVDMYGSVIADRFSQGNGVPFHYDASLRTATVNDEAVHFDINRWSE
jgi:hypothetical protein